MLLIGSDWRPHFEQAAMLDSATGETKVRRLEHENGEALALRSALGP